MQEGDEWVGAGMRQPDPLETLDRRHDPALLLERDPLLWHALRLHGRTWDQTKAGKLELPYDDAGGLPAVTVSSLSHRLAWRGARGDAILDMWWISRRAGWIAQLTIACMPELLALALVGRRLDEIIDVPGADAWRIAGAEMTPGVQTQLTLERAVETVSE